MKNGLSVLIIFLLGCSVVKKEQTESFDAGFKTLITVDRSRIYKPDSDTTDILHYRPLDIDIWYPARVKGTDHILLFRDFLSLLEKRANHYTGSNNWNGVTSQIAKSFCDGYKCSDTTKLLNYKTRSFRNAKPVNTGFPLVIYLCAYNGMSYENFTLLEELAMNGFVVVSINSIGRYPGDMTMKKEDLSEQVNDAIASLKAIKFSTEINFSKIGIIGYSWGGLSGAILAARIPNVSCLISLDGSEFYHYGEAKEESLDFEGIRNSPEFKSLRISVPYLRLESSQLIKSDKIDSVYNFSEKLSGEKLILKIDSAQHEDFSCLSLVVRESGNCRNNHLFNTVVKLVLPFLQDHLKSTILFSHVIEQETNKTIHTILD